jgi:hypothetical protein
MTSRIAYAYDQGLFFSTGLLQGFLPPGIPIYRIMGMLQQVRTGGVDQWIGISILGLLGRSVVFRLVGHDYKFKPACSAGVTKVSNRSGGKMLWA